MTKSRGEIANFSASAILSIVNNSRHPFMLHEFLDMFIRSF